MIRPTRAPSCAAACAAGLIVGMTFMTVPPRQFPRGQFFIARTIRRHGRACPGHPRLSIGAKTWMPGTRPGMTGIGSIQVDPARLVERRPALGFVAEETVELGGRGGDGV